MKCDGCSTEGVDVEPVVLGIFGEDAEKKLCVYCAVAAQRNSGDAAGQVAAMLHVLESRIVNARNIEDDDGLVHMFQE